MYREKFILSVLRQGSPIKETGSRSNRKVAIPFGSEYKLRLKNKNDRSCAVRLSIDGSPVSNFGDFIVTAGGTVDLERFVTDSMSRGKRFKFVTLDHRDVDDPTRSENGIIRAEFRLAKQSNGINITPTDWLVVPPNWEHGDDTGDFSPSNDWSKGTGDVDVHQYYNSSSGRQYKSSGPKKRSATFSAMSNSVVGAMGAFAAPAAHTEAGATVEGRGSNQGFGHSHLDVENRAVVLELKMVGIKQGQVGSRTTSGRFCVNCGSRVRQRDKYCAGCGRRI